MVAKCLGRQTEQDFEWIIVSPFNLLSSIEKEIGDGYYTFVAEPEKREGDYYSLNKAWNRAFTEVNGELIVSIVDGLWFPPNTLEKLWTAYDYNILSCVSGIGHQYDQVENGKPEHLVWKDPRVRDDYGSFYEVPHSEMELCVASFPTQAVIDVGGVDEKFDRYAALSEKEMMARMYKAGYKTYIDQTVEYRAMKHDRLSPEWDKHYMDGWPYYEQCMREIADGTRLRLDFLKNRDYNIGNVRSEKDDRPKD